MAKLAFSFDGVIVKEIVLTSDRITIGRHARCDIAINDPAITGRHAEITCTSSSYFIEDSASTNGTFVNGIQIAKKHLEHADVITIGKYRIVYLEELDFPDCRPIGYFDFLSGNMALNLAMKTRSAMSIYDRNQGRRSSAALDKMPAIVSSLNDSGVSIKASPPALEKPKPNLVRRIMAALKRP